MAEDLSQEIFLKIWEHRKTMAELDSFRAYLFITARNHTLSTLVKASRQESTLSEILSHYHQASAPPAEDRLLLDEYSAFLKKALDTVPPRARLVFQMCREQGMTYDQVARELGITRNSVRNHMVLSMKILRSAVSKELGISLSLFLVILYGIK
jgi:RNA polymerase sigma factor (sigma-70 family)